MPLVKTSPRTLVACLLLTSCLFTTGCDSSTPSHAAPDSGTHSAEGNSDSKEESVPVEIGFTSREEMVALYSTSATLRAQRRATVTTRTSGVLTTLHVEEGMEVQEGQALAELENEEQRIAHSRSQATAETRRREFERLEQLFAQALVSEEQFEQARRDHQDAKHAVDLASLELSRTVMTAPFSGVVLTRHLDVGNTITQGTPVYDLADLTPLYTDVTVPERHVALLHAGQGVTLTPDATNVGVAAEIERIAPEVDSKTGTVKVTLAVSEGEALRPGTFVRVDITTDRHQDTLVVPRTALVAEGRRWYLFRVDHDTASRVEVALGYEDSTNVEIFPLIEGLLDAGVQVVTAGAGALEDGATVHDAGNQDPKSDGDATTEAPADEPA